MISATVERYQQLFVGVGGGGVGATNKYNHSSKRPSNQPVSGDDCDNVAPVDGGWTWKKESRNHHVDRKHIFSCTVAGTAGGVAAADRGCTSIIS